MPQILASLDDINTHLPSDKAQATDAKTELLQLDAVRTIKGMLSGTFTPVTLAAWGEPADTPVFIRSIAGRLIAARFYALLYSEDQTEVPEYAQWLYDQAIADLGTVITGVTILEEVTEVVNTGGRLTEDMFFPNGDGTAEPKFLMDQRL
jgi:hypothetical protein